MTKKKIVSYELTPEEIKKVEELHKNLMMLKHQRANLILAEANYIRQNGLFWMDVGARLKLDFFSRNYHLEPGRIVMDE